MIPDPASQLDGRQTFLEIYTSGNTVTESSPPCPSVDRFCIFSTSSSSSSSSSSASSSGGGSAASTGSSSSTDNSDSDDENTQKFEYLARASRLVLRLVVAKPSKSPVSSTTLEPDVAATTFIDAIGGAASKPAVEYNGPPLDLFAMLPNFTFTVTSLSPRHGGSKSPPMGLFFYVPPWTIAFLVSPMSVQSQTSHDIAASAHIWIDFPAELHSKEPVHPLSVRIVRGRFGVRLFL